MIFLEYPKCSTCKKAKNWLDKYHISYKDRNIVSDQPKKEELRTWIIKSNYPIKKFFNTSGMLYREMKLSQKLDSLSFEMQLDLLSSNGMLVKRPLLVDNDQILVGFNEEEWKNKLL